MSNNEYNYLESPETQAASSVTLKNSVGGLTIINMGDLREEKIKEQRAVKEATIPQDVCNALFGEWEHFIVREDRVIEGKGVVVTIHSEFRLALCWVECYVLKLKRYAVVPYHTNNLVRWGYSLIIIVSGCPQNPNPHAGFVGTFSRIPGISMRRKPFQCPHFSCSTLERVHL